MAAALQIHASHQFMADSRATLLKQLVFDPRSELATRDRKLYRSYRRALLSDDAKLILIILWKESPYIPEAALEAAKLQRAFSETDITQHGLAVALSQIPSEVAAINSRIRTITLAAEAYGLITRTAVSPTKVFIQGSALLHEFMTELARLYNAANRQIPPSAARTLDP
jgi:hypothetical protein